MPLPQIEDQGRDGFMIRLDRHSDKLTFVGELPKDTDERGALPGLRVPQPFNDPGHDRPQRLRPGSDGLTFHAHTDTPGAA